MASACLIKSCHAMQVPTPSPLMLYAICSSSLTYLPVYGAAAVLLVLGEACYCPVMQPDPVLHKPKEAQQQTQVSLYVCLSVLQYGCGC